MAGIGKTREQLMQSGSSPAMPYVLGFVAILVMCYTLGALLARLQADDASRRHAPRRARLGLLSAACIALNYGIRMRGR